MVFSSILFLFVYLPVVLAVYYIVPARYRNLWLFIVNLVFYGWGEPVYILLMVFSIALNYAAGLLIARYRLTDDKKAQAVLTVNTVVNLALLIFFKYFDLLAATLSRIPGISIPALGLTLPIGISFYTFQSMSYSILHVPDDVLSDRRLPRRHGGTEKLYPLRHICGALPAADRRADRPV